MIKESVERALNKQINAELFSAYLYLSMATYFDSINLHGFSNWMTIQAHEELTHAERIYYFVQERGGRVILETINNPQNNWENPLRVFEDAYNHEKMITGMINDLVNLVIEEKDHATNSFLQWFVTEQVEEESSVEEVIHKLRLIGDSGKGIYMLDQFLNQRTFAPPTDLNYEIW